MDIDNNAGQATPDDLCNAALLHYEQASKECHAWMSIIPKAIEIYRQYLKVAEAIPEKYSKEDIGKSSSLLEERKIWMKGYNQCHDDYTFALMKRLEKAEEAEVPLF